MELELKELMSILIASSEPLESLIAETAVRPWTSVIPSTIGGCMGTPGDGHGLLENAMHTEWAGVREATIPATGTGSHTEKHLTKCQ